MILVSDKTQQKTYYFPKEKNSGKAAFLKLFSHLSKNEYLFNVSGSAVLDLYYALSPDFSDVPNGEYDYTIYDVENNVLQNGLLRIGEYDAGDIIYDFKEEYIIYNPETGESEIIEYGDCTDAVNEAYRSGYTSGYADGYEEGSESGTGGYESGYTSGYTDGYQEGYGSGTTDGFNSGYSSGKTDGLKEGFDNGVVSGFSGGYTSGYTDGYSSGYTEGYEDAYDSGLQVGIESGKTIGFESGWTNGYSSGYTDGYSSGWTDGYISGSTPTPTPPTSGFESMYFTIQPLYDGNISWDAPNLSYRIDNGSWMPMSGTVAVERGQEIQFKGTNTCYSGYTITANFGFDVYGNIMSLVYGDNFENQTILTEDSEFYYLFRYKLVRNAENLILPATTLSTSCYGFMFEGCRALLTPPALPATTLSEGCYEHMFDTCLIMPSAPELPAITLAERCYQSMFYGCTSLVEAPVLPATTLAANCYGNMFYGCTSLVEAPVLPATTLAERCYYDMFCNCTSLTTAPELPATTLATECYRFMFYGCTSLVEAPELPATTLAERCYYQMFYYCTSLVEAPVLLATTLTERCYYQMFYKCSNLNYIKCLATDNSASYCTRYWVNGVASAGTFVKAAEMEDWSIGADGIPTDWVIENEGDVPVYFSLSALSSTTIPASYEGSLGVAVSASTYWNLYTGIRDWYKYPKGYYPDMAIEISANTTTSPKTYVFSGETMDGLASDTVIYTQAASAYTPTPSGYTDVRFSVEMLEDGDINWEAPNLYYDIIRNGQRDVGYQLNHSIDGLLAGDVVEFYVNADNPISYHNYTFTATGRHNVYGNIMSLNYVDFEHNSTLIGNSNFKKLFYNDTNLIDAGNLILPSTVLTNDCYFQMFEGCASLTTAPALPATTLATYCYDRMFYGCTNLNYIKCLATNISALGCTFDWVNGVSATGTFVKDANMSSWTTGNNGIPSGWTVINE